MSGSRGIRGVLDSALSPAQVDLVRRGWHRLKALDPRLALRRRAFTRANEDLGRAEMVLRPGLRIVVDPEARAGFEYFCFRSLEMARELDGFLARRSTRFRLLDIGAFHGLFSLAFTHGRAKAQALAIEPSPLAFPVLARQLAQNASAGSIRPLQVAVGARAGALSMRLDWHHLEACAPGESGESGVLEVPLRTVDDICREHDFEPDVIKLDVEGYELEVLRGAEAVLASARPDLFLEVHPQSLQRLGSSTAELFDLLERLSYRVLDFRERNVSRRQFVRQFGMARYRCSATPAVLGQDQERS